MEKFKNVILAILSTAWYGALTAFCTVVFMVGIVAFAEKILHGTVVGYVLVGIGLIFITWFVGDCVKNKAEKWNNRRR